MIIEITLGGGTAQLGFATTGQLMEELAVRMEITQNSTNGEELAKMCREALAKLDGGVLRYSPMRPRGLSQEGER